VLQPVRNPAHPNRAAVGRVATGPAIGVFFAFITPTFGPL
jgi:hypothetical protein